MLVLKNRIYVLVGVLVLAIIYYFAIYKTTEDKIVSLNADISNIKNEIEYENAKLNKYTLMSTEIEEGKAGGSMVYDYDNTTAELSYLSSVVSRADDYNISFDDAITNDGLYVRRGVTISFTAANYYAAKEILLDIANCPYRTIIKNIVIVPTSDASSNNPSLSKGSEVSACVDLIFIELYSGINAGLIQEGGANESK